MPASAATGSGGGGQVPRCRIAQQGAWPNCRSASPDLLLNDSDEGGDFKLTATLKPEAQKRIQEFALQQNITTLRNRVNELGVAEPIIQQQGVDRVVVQLPGVQDTAKAKDILGRTATLEIRMVDEEHDVIGRSAERPDAVRQRSFIPSAKGAAVTGEEAGGADRRIHHRCAARLRHSRAANRPCTSTWMAAARASSRRLTRENVGKRMAILLIEKGKAEVITAPVIREEIGGGRVQITGTHDHQEASDVALLLRAGALAAPMEIIEERTVGPSLGAENIAKRLPFQHLSVLSPSRSS